LLTSISFQRISKNPCWILQVVLVLAGGCCSWWLVVVVVVVANSFQWFFLHDGMYGWHFFLVFSCGSWVCLGMWGWLNYFHVFERCGIVAHGCSGSHCGFGVIGTFYINCCRKMYQHWCMTDWLSTCWILKNLRK